LDELFVQEAGEEDGMRITVDGRCEHASPGPRFR